MDYSDLFVLLVLPGFISLLFLADFTSRISLRARKWDYLVLNQIAKGSLNLYRCESENPGSLSRLRYSGLLDNYYNVSQRGTLELEKRFGPAKTASLSENNNVISINRRTK